ncbi:MAG: hypothetical protein GY797_04155 [Deltaproteobacteria bacterium]|nr:hypothetical protein [Deltaproteobacteria bacterium]
MKYLLLNFFIFSLLIPVATTSANDLSISITEPADDSKVEYREYVKGTVSDPLVEICVVIRPSETSVFWIQPPVTVKKNGTWKVEVYFGRDGKDFGKEFEIRAYANPISNLSEGKSNRWPKAEAHSDVIDVIRE